MVLTAIRMLGVTPVKRRSMINPSQVMVENRALLLVERVAGKLNQSIVTTERLDLPGMMGPQTEHPHPPVRLMVVSHHLAMRVQERPTCLLTSPS